MMDKGFKRFILLSFIACLIIVLTACGGGTASSTDSGNGTSGGSSSNSTNQNKSDAAKNTSSNSGSDKSNSDTTTSAQKLDLKGRTITLAAWWNASPKTDKSALGQELIAQQKKVEKEYNVKIQYDNIPYNDMLKKFTTSVISGKPFADIVRLQFNWALPAVTQGLLLPTNSYAPDISKLKYVMKNGKFSGQNYGFDSMNYNQTVGWTSGIFYNKDLFKKYNLPDPHQLVKEGKWNWNEFEKLAQESTKDTNGDGKDNSWGFAGWDQEMMQFFLASNAAQMVNTKTGKVNMSDPNTVTAFDFVNKLYNTDHVIKVEPKSNPDNGAERTTFKDGDVAMTYGWVWEAKYWKSISYGFVQFPKGPAGTDFVSPFDGMHAWFIPKGVKDPKAVISVYNALQDVKPLEDYPGQNYFQQNLKTQVDIDAARQLMNKLVSPNYTMFGSFPIKKLTSDIIVKHTNVTSALKQYQQSVQTIVNTELKANK